MDRSWALSGLLVGVALEIAGLASFQIRSSFLESGARAEGTVIERIEERSRLIHHHPVVSFQDGRGRSVQFKFPYNTGHAIGDRVPVVYDPRDPWDAVIDDVRLFFSPVLLILLGAAGILTGLAPLWHGAPPLRHGWRARAGSPPRSVRH